MAAFCGCCGAEITSKVEACPVCGMPRHGMQRLEPTPEFQKVEEKNPVRRPSASHPCFGC